MDFLGSIITLSFWELLGGLVGFWALTAMAQIQFPVGIALGHSSESVES